jgi:hypothetical protein
MPPDKVRFTSVANYCADIALLRKHFTVGANRLLTGLIKLTITDPSGAYSIVTFMKPKNLYLLAFESDTCSFAFSDCPNPQLLRNPAKTSMNLTFPSRYDDLMAFANTATGRSGVALNPDALTTAIKTLSEVTNDTRGFGNDQKRAAAAMALAISEAARFNSVLSKFIKNLNYAPVITAEDIKAIVQNWQSATKAESPDVAVSWLEGD